MRTPVLRPCGALVGVVLLAACAGSAPDDAVHAIASVTRLSGSKCSWLPDAGDLCPTLTVMVYQEGAAPYEATIDTRIPEIAASRVQPGSWVAVLVDPAAASRVFVDVPSLSEPPPIPVIGDPAPAP